MFNPIDLQARVFEGMRSRLSMDTMGQDMRPLTAETMGQAMRPFTAETMGQAMRPFTAGLCSVHKLILLIRYYHTERAG